MLLYILVGDIEAPLWYGGEKELAVKIFSVSSLTVYFMRVIFRFSRKRTLQNFRPVYSNAAGRKGEKSTSSVVASDMVPVTELMHQDDIFSSRRTVTPPLSKSSILLLFTNAVCKSLNGKPLSIDEEKESSLEIAQTIFQYYSFTY